MVLTHELGYWFDRFVGKSSKERSVHLSRNMFSAYLSIEPGAGLLLTDISPGCAIYNLIIHGPHINLIT